MSPDTQIKPRVEPPQNKETFKFTETVLITGGAKGTGLVTAELLAAHGVNLILGSRSQANFDTALDKLHDISHDTRLRRKPTGITVPFKADLTDSESFNYIFERMANLGLDLGSSDVVHSAAAGMEEFSRDLIKSLVRLKRSSNQAEDIAALRSQISEWVDNSIQNGDCNVNYQGGVNLATSLLDNKQGNDPTWLIYYSSLPSTFYPEFFESDENHGLSFYKGVAQSKFMFEQWLHLNAEDLVQQGIFPVVISANLLYDTDIQMLLRAISPLSQPEDRARLTDPAQYPTTSDLAQSAVNIMKHRPSADSFPTWPAYQYLMSPGDVIMTPPFEFMSKLRLPI